MRRSLRAAFCRSDGKVRAGWALSAEVVLFAAIWLGVRLGMEALFARLFEVWGLTGETVAFAPAWARFLAGWHAGLSAGVAALCAAAFGWFAARKRPLRRSGGRGIVRGLLLGALPAAAVALAGLLLDSLRLERGWGRPAFSGDQVLSLLLIFLSALAAEVLLRRLIRRDGLPAWLIVGLSMLAEAVLTGLPLSAWKLLNALLLGALGCVVYSLDGFGASLCMRFARMTFTTLVFGWPGSGAPSVYPMYDVSESWLTGGAGGAVNGLGFLLATALALIWLGIARRRMFGNAGKC